MVKALLAIEGVIKKSCMILNQVGLVVICGMVLLTVAEVIGRRLFNFPIIGSHEIQQMCLMTAAFFVWGHCQIQRGNIVITFIADMIPKKAMPYIEIISYSISTVMYGILGWRLIWQALHLKATGVVHAELQLIEWPFLFVTALIGCTLFVLALMQTVARYIVEAVEK